MNKNVVIFGISAFAEMIYIWSKEMDNINVVAFMADDEYCDDKPFCGLPVWKFSSLDSEMVNQYDFLMCIGYKNMRNRLAVYERLKEKGCRFVNFIHPTVTILPNASMGQNNIILANVTIENNVRIGDNNVIWSQTIIGHNVIMGSHNYLAAKVLIGGNSIMGNGCFFGNAVCTINNLKISDETFVVAGSVLLKNTKPYVKYWGNPAERIDSHKDMGIII
jgi:sugar O-acyltransferase (sialic acid O-acetyltransferase NeuD family)